jgi:hypothetical protein
MASQPEIDPIIADLNDRIQFHSGEADRLRRLVTDLKSEYSARASTGRAAATASSARSQARQRKVAVRRAAAGSARGSAKSPRRVSKGSKPSISGVVKEAALSQTKPFTKVDIEAYIATRYPALKVDTNRISQELYALRKAGVTKFHLQGKKGTSHTYVLVT